MSGLSSSPDGVRTNSITITPEVAEKLERFAQETRETYIRIARDRICRLRIDEIALGAEGAVNAAWVIFCDRIREAKIEPSLGRHEFEGFFGLLLLRVLADTARRHRAGLT